MVTIDILQELNNALSDVTITNSLQTPVHLK